MKKIKTKTDAQLPEFYLTVGKSRRKIYKIDDENIVYLKNKEEFELELFNPYIERISAKIYLNNIYIGNDLIINPGQRIFLERYLKDNNKFRFDIYEVDDNNESKNAIKNNGLIKITFHKLYKYKQWNDDIYDMTSKPYININHIDYKQGYYHYIDSNKQLFKSTMTSTNLIPLQSDINSFVNIDAMDNNKIETGIIGSGSISKQEFDYSHDKFEYDSFIEYDLKILPFNKKQIEHHDLVSYCTSCGARRRKQSHKFCPLCGEKY